ncbi:MAG: DUF1430 domain-containing protein [Clostridiales bacterium]|nr:DUF1430 domain-containing protein [Clostridiales bacterium]
MKKILMAILACIIFCFAWISEIQVSNEEITKLDGMDRNYTVAFYIPDGADGGAPDNLFSALIEATQSTESNIFRSLLADANGGGYEVEKYALLTEKSEYMSAFEIEDGDTLTAEETQSRTFDGFLSTKQTGDEKQTGVIASNMRGVDVVVRPMYLEFSYYKPDGSYCVELGDGVSEGDFLEALSEAIGKYCGMAFSVEDFEGGDVNYAIPYTDTFVYMLMLAALCVCFIVIMLYFILRETKKISVMRLFGQGKLRLSWSFVFPFFAELVILVFLAMIVVAIQGNGIAYWGRIVGRAATMSAVVFAVIYAVFIAAAFSGELSVGLKGGGRIGAVSAINTVVSVICICAVIYSGQTVFADIINQASLARQLSGWSDAGDYGGFYPYYFGYDLSFAESDEAQLAINYDLYEYLNAEGALYIDVYYYEDSFLQMNTQVPGMEWHSYASVNPNYLEKYEILDEDGNRVSVREDEKDWILLVPEKYQGSEDEIISYYEDSLQEDREYVINNYGDEYAPPENQKFRIIWIEDGQRIFGFNSSAGTNDNGWIADAAIHVMTETNSSPLDRDCVRGNADGDPLKIRLDGDSRQTYESLSGLLDELGLSDNLKAIVSVSERMSEKLAETRRNLMLSLSIAVAGILILLFFVIQNTAINFDRNKKKYIVKKIHGISFARIYGRYLAVSIVICLVAAAAFSVLAGGEDMAYFIGIGIGLAAVQTLASIICIAKSERRHISDVLKGE